MSASQKGKNNPNADPTVRTIEHPIHGKVTGTQQEIREKHPGLNIGYLIRLKGKPYKGWRLLDFSV